MSYILSIRSAFLSLCLLCACGTAMAIDPSAACLTIPPRTDDEDRLLSDTEWLARIIAADVPSIRQGGPSGHPYYMHELSSMLRGMMNLDCKTEDGVPLADSVLNGFDLAFRREPDWNESMRSVALFKKNGHYAPMAVILEAQYWFSYAWDARGGGFGSSVTDDGWKLYRDRLLLAEKLLQENKLAASAIPCWYPLMISIQTGLGRSKQMRDEIFEEGVAKYKNYQGLYQTMTIYLDPRWGGSFDALDKFIDWSANHTKEFDGDAMYARLYTGVRRNLLPEQRFLKDTQVKWPRLRAAYYELLKKYPNSKNNLNSFASIACEAGDKNTYVSLRKQISTDVVRQSWTKKYPLELCDAKFPPKR
jgi:hypothetical protein